MNKEKREKPYLFRRVLAYLIDIILVALLASTIKLVVSGDSAEVSYMKEYTELIEKYNNKEISEEEFTTANNELYYNNSRATVDMSIIICGVSVVYYVVMCFFCHGITLGKYLMKLQIVSANEKELNIGNYLIRGLFINLILMHLVNILCVYLMDKNTFTSIYPRVSSVLSMFILVTMLFMMYREDGRGLHDLMANTKIISTKKQNKETKEEVVEAKIVEEKKIEKSNKKKTSKKNNKKEVKK